MMKVDNDKSTKKTCIYAAYGVSQTPKKYKKQERRKLLK